ncbi:copper chaperone [Roseomonas rosea]|jgi:copper chaperone|uniref:Copper chaperone n=1 Tax=Muricoccus roseus TaxID=198092 RepID=A0A1M6GU07_9PROT|nr:heavy-metal-associated domain-containing protein [Roseomonas rosea]SHJ13433.1 copper chaperone [Roseomonas rosea]
MIRFHIPNMTCGGCAKGVAATIRDADPQAEAQVDLEKREVTVERASLDAVALAEHLLRDGWHAERLGG